MAQNLHFTSVFLLISLLVHLMHAAEKFIRLSYIKCGVCATFSYTWEFFSIFLLDFHSWEKLKCKVLFLKNRISTIFWNFLPLFTLLVYIFELSFHFCVILGSVLWDESTTCNSFTYCVCVCVFLMPLISSSFCLGNFVILSFCWFF